MRDMTLAVEVTSLCPHRLQITFAFWLALVWLLGMFMVCCTQSVP